MDLGRRGRNRKSGKREPNGKPQRVPVRVQEHEARETVLSYRRNVFGLKSDVLSDDRKAATLLGRLCLKGIVSEAQYRAGEDWLGLVNGCYAAANAPRGFRTAGGTALAIDEDAEAARFADIRRRFYEANLAVEDRAPVSERIERMKALSWIIVQEQDHPKMHGTLRTALNALVRHFKMTAIAA